MNDSNSTIRQPSLADRVDPLAALAGLIAGALALFARRPRRPDPGRAPRLPCVAALIATKNGPRVHGGAGRSRCDRLGDQRDLHPVRGRAPIGVWNPRHHPDAGLLRHPGARPAGTTPPPPSSAVSSRWSIGSLDFTAATIGVGLVGDRELDRRVAEITAGAVIRRLPMTRPRRCRRPRADRPDRRRRRPPAHQAPGLDVGAGVPHRVGRSRAESDRHRERHRRGGDPS